MHYITKRTPNGPSFQCLANKDLSETYWQIYYSPGLHALPVTIQLSHFMLKFYHEAPRKVNSSSAFFIDLSLYFLSF